MTPLIFPPPNALPDRTYRHPARTASPRRRTPSRPTPPVGQASPNEPNRWSRVTWRSSSRRGTTSRTRNQKRADPSSFRVDRDDHASARRAASSEHGSRCQPRDVEIRIRCVVVDCIVINAHGCQELARFWSQTLGCIITSRARTSVALSRRREVPPWMWPATSYSSEPAGRRSGTDRTSICDQRTK